MVIGKGAVFRGCLGNMRNGRGGIICGLGVNRSKGGLGNAGGLGSEFANSSGVSMSDLLNWDIVLKTVMSELVSETMPDDMLTWGDSGGGKAKSGMMGIGFWLGGKWNGEGIQLVGSSWARKMIVLRLKVFLFNFTAVIKKRLEIFLSIVIVLCLQMKI